MYLRKIHITNIRSIFEFTMEFPKGKEPGWHVLIGDNGSGKSTIVRSIAAVLIGPEEIGQVRPYWEEWLSQNAEEGSIKLRILYDKDLDRIGQTRPPADRTVENEFSLKRNGRVTLDSNYSVKRLSPRNFNWGNNRGWFSVAYGPFRRFTGGNSDWNKVYYSAPKAGAHLSVFGEDIALTEALEWLKELDRRRLKEKESLSNHSKVTETPASYKSEADLVFHGIQQFISNSNLLPHQATFEGVNLDGDPEFEDGNGNIIKITQLSDGFRSILSLTFELIRQLVRVYGAEEVFKNVDQEEFRFQFPGVVLIDEIDAHLHPTWQTRIGQWFTKYFPNLQFIVTTHSPLICRASANGSIWRLAAPGSDLSSGEVTGSDRDKLIYGNILDAYGTDVFGQDVERGDEGRAQLERYSLLSRKKAFGASLSSKEEAELNHLKQVFSTDAPLAL